MQEKLRVFESETKSADALKLQVNPKRADLARDVLFPPARQEFRLTRELVLRLIELIKQV